MTRLAALLAWALLLAAPARAGAEPDPAARAAARRLIEQAEAHYRVSDYPAALASYRAAHRLDPRPDLLFNIARCHEVMAQLDEAIRAYERYLEEKPQAEDAALVRARIERLRSRQPASRLGPTAPVTTSRAPSWQAPTGWALLGVGGASLVAGLICGGLARAKANEFEDGVKANRTYAALSEVDQAGRRYQTAQIATLVVGGVLAGAAAGVLIWDRRERLARPRVAWLAPLLGEGGIGLGAAGRF